MFIINLTTNNSTGQLNLTEKANFSGTHRYIKKSNFLACLKSWNPVLDLSTLWLPSSRTDI